MNPQISHTEAGQLPLSFAPSIQTRFEAFHAAHPEVYAYLVACALRLKTRGRTRYGIRGLWEQARWHFYVERDMGTDFKLNDHFPAHYSRLIMAEHPDLADFFETRSLRA